MPPPLNDDQFSALIDETAPADVQKHLEVCAACAARFEQVGQFEQQLHTHLARWDCPPSQQLADYHLGRLSGENERILMRHLTICARCVEEIEELRLFLSDEDRVPAPASRAAAPSRRRPLLGRLLAPSGMPALRGGGDGPLQVEAAGMTLFLDRVPTDAGQITLQGQLVADEQDDWIGALIEVRQNNELVAVAEADEFGSFGCGPIPVASTELRLIPRQGQIIFVPAIELG